jgi:holo-[acyl-carrier protein] synthase
MSKPNNIKVGTDICSVVRIKNAYEKYGQRFLQRILTANERKYVENRALKNNLMKPFRLSEALAGRFAAKEAVAKALGTGWKGIYWKEVEIVNSESGAPQVVLSGRAKKILSKLGFSHIEISLSHEREYALATALIF